EGPPLKIGAVTSLMSSLVARCEVAEAELKNKTLPGHVAGEAWDRWVRELTTILRKRGLPTEPGKNWDGPGVHELSHFTALLCALHECLPSMYRRQFNSIRAQIQATHRAQRGLNPESVGDT